MPDIQVSEKLIAFLSYMPFFFLSLAVHEFAHAYSAKKLGDDTAESQGRLTLNPIKHIDLIGSIVMPLLAFSSGFMLIGWAKPVPVNPAKFKNPLKHDAIVTAAGPASNFLLAVLFFVLLLAADNFIQQSSSLIINMLWFGVYFNVFLFAFNLLPIPPLDGSHIIADLFPNKMTAKLRNLGFYGTFILLIFIYSPLWDYFMNFINFILEIFVSFL